jgi:predicted ATPase
MKTFDQIRYQDLTEGVYDKNIFKAFFLAGGPGSGKSFVTGSAFGGSGMKVINSDNAFEKGRSFIKDA